jgi:putative membrane protein
LFAIAIPQSLDWLNWFGPLTSTYRSWDGEREENMLLENTTAKIAYVSGLTLFLTSLGCWAVLGHPESSPVSSEAQAAMTDLAFAKDAARLGMAEIKLGKLAGDSGSSEAVKTFGTRMEAEHTKAGKKLKAAAALEHITLPADLAAKDQATYDRLSKLSGADFDRAFAQDMVKYHQHDLQAFDREANRGKDAAIRGFASETVPMIQQHLEQAKEMLKTVSPTSSRRTNGSTGRPARGH